MPDMANPRGMLYVLDTHVLMLNDELVEIY